MSAAPLLPEIRIDDHAGREVARAFLEGDRLYAAYALADLDGEAEVARWWVATRDGKSIAVVVVVESLPFRPTFAMGDVSGLAELFRSAVHEPRVILAAPPAARPALEALYRFERCDRMHRMAVDRATFRPRTTAAPSRLGPEQLDDIVDLYGHISRTYFTPERVAREVYYGVYEGRTLVAAAGTHVQSASSNLAAVGNVLTRLGYRGRGYATSVTSAVTAAALASHADVVLNVRADNAPAVHVYEALGYHLHAPFLEGPAVRRAGWERLTDRLFGSSGGGEGT